LCDSPHTLTLRGRVSFQVRFPRFDGARIMTQLSDRTWMVVYSIAATLLALSWIYIPA